MIWYKKCWICLGEIFYLVEYYICFLKIYWVFEMFCNNIKVEIFNGKIEVVLLNCDIMIVKNFLKICLGEFVRCLDYLICLCSDMLIDVFNIFEEFLSIIGNVFIFVLF